MKLRQGLSEAVAREWGTLKDSASRIKEAYVSGREARRREAERAKKNAEKRAAARAAAATNAVVDLGE
jgi:hypothetical protein